MSSAEVEPSAAADREAPGPRRLSIGEHVWAFVRELFVVVVGAVILASLLRAFVGQMFIIPSESMRDTLQVGDRVVVEKLSSIKRGQIVVFEDPGGWLTGPVPAERGAVGRALEFVGVLPDTATEHLIKRAVGLPGDRVVCCDASGRIRVNDHALDESGYLYRTAAEAPTPSTIRFDVTVPTGRLFVLGDNRGSSRDSRCHLNDDFGGVPGENAFVPMDLVVGRALAVAWPLAAAERLRTPTGYAEIGPAGGSPATPEITAGPEADC